MTSFGGFSAPMLWITSLILAVIVVIALFRYDEARRKRKLEATFADRPRLQASEFYQQFFHNQGIPKEFVLGVRKTLEKQLDADLSRLVPSGDFSQNLAFFFQDDSMADVEIVLALEEAFEIEISNDEAANAHTIEEIVNLVWKKRHAKVKPNI
ncbi:MAG: acyl carrier protein [Gammaproteobacteria bacterium]